MICEITDGFVWLTTTKKIYYGDIYQFRQGFLFDMETCQKVWIDEII